MLRSYYRFRSIAGLCIHLDKEGGYTLHLCLISVEQKELRVEKKITGLSDISEIGKYLPSGTLISLNILGRGVLYKRTERSAQRKDIAAIIPNVKTDEFYTQFFETGSLAFYSMVRRSAVDAILRQLDVMGRRTVMLSLGPFPVTYIRSQLNIYGESLDFDGHHIEIDEQGDWKDYRADPGQRSAFPVKIENEPMPEELIVPYACAFQTVLADKLSPICCLDAPTSSVFREEANYRRLTVRSVVSLLAMFLVLLVNLFCFTSLNSANMQMEERLASQNLNQTELEKIASVVNRKEALINRLGWDGISRKGKMIDGILSQLPVGVTLDEIAVDPPARTKGFLGGSPIFGMRQIQIHGESAEVIPVNEWIARIGIQQWVKKVRLDDFRFDGATGKGNFSILINY